MRRPKVVELQRETWAQCIGHLFSRKRRTLAGIACALAIGMAFQTAPTAIAEEIFISKNNNDRIPDNPGGLQNDQDDIIYINFTGTTLNSASIFFDGSLFANSENIDAFAFLDATTIVLSTTTNATIGADVFGPGDLFSIDLNTNTAALFLSNTIWGGAGTTDIDALHVFGPGDVVVSTSNNNRSIDALTDLSNQDLVRIQFSDPYTVTSATLFLDGDDIFPNGTRRDIDGLHILGPGHVLLSTANAVDRLITQSGEIDPGFSQADIFEIMFIETAPGEFVVVDGSASLFFDHSAAAFYGDNSAQINALSLAIPEPSSLLLLGAGALSLLRRQRRNMQNVEA